MELKTKPRIQVGELAFVEMISAGEIQGRISKMGSLLQKEYADKNPIFIGILNGAFMFTADLVRAVNVECDIAFVKLSSYQGMDSTGKVNVELDLKMDISGRNIIVIEDIIDTGLTLSFFLDHLQEHKPASVKLVTLLEKPKAIKHEVKTDMVGFSIPNRFVIGYGLDYNGKCRNLASIYELDEEKKP